MENIIGENHYLRLANGNIGDSKVIHKFGANAAVGTTIEDIWANGGVYTWLTTAVKLEAISTDADDTVGGDGARYIQVEGLDANFDEITEVIGMNGTSASTSTVQSFIRVHRAFVVETGTYQATTLTDTIQGNITIRTTGAGATHILLTTVSNTRMGQSEVLRYTIPKGYTGFLTHLTISVLSNQSINAFLFKRNNADFTTSNIRSKRLVWRTVGLSDPLEYHPMYPHKFEEATDVWMSAVVAATTSSVEGTFEIVLIKNEVINQW